MFYFTTPGFKLARRSDIVRSVFGVPGWYVLSDNEEQKLFSYLMTAQTVPEAILKRILDCSTICDEKYCYFCAESKPVMGYSRVPKRRD